ncbi:MAG: primosomal protein N', partial [Dehalococcoidia bacterium]
MPFAEVAVFAGRPQRQTFTYAIPSHLDVRVGHGVFVPFGRQALQGVVLELGDSSAVANPREIRSLIQEERLLSPARAALVRWIADSYLAPLAATVSLFLPPGFGRKPQRLLRAAPLADGAAMAALSERERLVLNAVTARGSVEAGALERALKDGKVGATIRALVQSGLVEERHALARPSVGAKTETVLHLALDREAARDVIDGWPQSKRSRRADLLERLQLGPVAWPEARRIAGGKESLERWLGEGGWMVREDDCVRLRTPAADADSVIATLRRTAAERRQVTLLEALLSAPRPELAVRQEANAGRADVEALMGAGLVKRERRRVMRDPLAQREKPREGEPSQRHRPVLTADQARAYGAIATALKAARQARDRGRAAGEIFLLQGVTGSGKTEVYLAAAESVRDAGGQTIVLVPEIALTPQTVDRFLARFPGRVAVLHSGLSPGEAYDQWERIREGGVDVVIGSRSALFAPAAKLSLVIVDEEHEWTYKQSDPAPRYHVREVLEEYQRLSGFVALFASATPDIVTASRAEGGRYRLLRLPQRVQRRDPGDPASAVQPAPLPEVDVVDLREELKRGNRSIFSEALAGAIETALAEGEQVLLFLNRRGVASFVCRECGEALTCERCSIPFPYHHPLGSGPARSAMGVGILRCHECGRTSPPLTTCPQCGSARIRPMGIGTQRLEEEVGKRFPRARPLRWDRDTARGKDGQRRLLERFLAGEANVLIGTQMIAKGLDLPSVTVVGVVNADLSLRLPDYTGPERTFQLITQVAGRAGRGPGGGRVIVQTYAPEHYAILTAAAQDFDSFYEAEMAARSHHDYPPYGRLARLVYADRKRERARDVATTMAESLLEDRDRRGLPG